MSNNPLLGSRISLISKKNIRYEGTLYSINETDATVALKDVQAFGTEGRESESETFVPEQETVHEYLLFRGCDIKDLHVHESTTAKESEKEELPSDPAILSTEPPKTEKEESVALSSSTTKQKTKKNESATAENETEENKKKSPRQATKNNENEQEENAERNANAADKSNRNKANNRRNKNNTNNPKQMVGSGASLLRRKARGVVDGDNGPENAHEKNFDFESNLAEFDKTNDVIDENDDDDDENVGTYEKNDFFDSISCDVSDRQSGVDNRLRGGQERSLNTETFGATSLGYGRRNNRRYRGGGRGGGRGRGRGGGRGGGSDGQPRENNRWRGENQSSRGGGRGRNRGRREYGDGGLSANNASDGQ